jgi:hypothetical protein
MVFFLLLLINLFPYFRQIKKNLIGLVFIFIFITLLVIVDLGLEFLPFAYLLIYVGAVAVMFLFVIIAVDPKMETQKDTFEVFTIQAILINNLLTGTLYFLLSLPGLVNLYAFDLNRFFFYKLKVFELVNLYLDANSSLELQMRHLLEN